MYLYASYLSSMTMHLPTVHMRFLLGQPAIAFLGFILWMGTTDAENFDEGEHGRFDNEVTISSDSFETPPKGYHYKIKDSEVGLQEGSGTQLNTSVNLRLSLIPGELTRHDSVKGVVQLKKNVTIGHDLGWKTPDGAKPKYRLERIKNEGREPFFELSKYNVYSEVVVYELLEVGKTVIRLGSDLKTLPKLPQGYTWNDVVEQASNSFRLGLDTSKQSKPTTDVLITKRIIKNVYLKAGQDSHLSRGAINGNLQLRGQRPLLNPFGKISWVGASGKIHRAPRAPR